jgi:hypothetical protein
VRREKRKDQNLIICPRTKQFTDLIVCAASCKNRCEEYYKTISYEVLEKFVQQHPEYKIVGEIMATKKTSKKEKRFWILNKDKTFTEVSEKEVLDNPQEYLDKEIWEKPPYRYEVVISLKRIRET